MTERAARRPVRLPASLAVGDRAIDGTIIDISASGMRMRVVHEVVDPNALPVGALVDVSFDLGDTGGPLAACAELVWTDPLQLDPVGNPALGLGMKLRKVSRTLSERLDTFVHNSPHVVLVVDDEVPIHRILVRALEPRFKMIACDGAATALTTIENNEVAVLLVDYCLPGIDGAELLRQVVRRWPDLPADRLMMTGNANLEGELAELACSGVISGWIAKPWNSVELLQSIERATQAYLAKVEKSQCLTNLTRENVFLREQLGQGSASAKILGNSPAIQHALGVVAKVARTEAAILITGETGTGKDLTAKVIHELSRRSSRAFLPVNCAAVPRELIESELFGHVAGSFTGAIADKRGLFQVADGGTLFLDEVSSLDLPAQAKLLRVLQDGEIRAVGGTANQKVDVRVFAGTNCDLRQLIKRGKFREDLYYRLAVVPIDLPPLRARREDIVLLADEFLRRFAKKHFRPVVGFAPEVLIAFEGYRWPGNVRELEHAVERAVVLAHDSDIISLEHLSPAIGRCASVVKPVRSAKEPLSPSGSYDDMVVGFQRGLIERALQASGGRVRQAARDLRMDHSRLSKLIGRLGLRATRS